MTQQTHDMELLQALLQADSSTDTLMLVVAGKSIPIVYKRMGWMAKSRCVSEATKFVPSPGTPGGVTIHFAWDVYKKAALKEMVVSSPIPLTDTVIEKLGEEAGNQLELIIPDPFAVAAMVDAAKKESATSPAPEGDPQ